LGEAKPFGGEPEFGDSNPVGEDCPLGEPKGFCAVGMPGIPTPLGDVMPLGMGGPFADGPLVGCAAGIGSGPAIGCAGAIGCAPGALIAPPMSGAAGVPGWAPAAGILAVMLAVVGALLLTGGRAFELGVPDGFAWEPPAISEPAGVGAGGAFVARPVSSVGAEPEHAVTPYIVATAEMT
jgi:hypothetical protein